MLAGDALIGMPECLAHLFQVTCRQEQPLALSGAKGLEARLINLGGSQRRRHGFGVL